MPISRGQMPRQMYGLGSIVKKAVKGVTGAVKKIAGSGLGKAALLGLGGAGLMGMGPLSALGGLGASSGTGIASILSKGKSFLGGLTTGQRLAGSLGLAALASAPQEVQEESSRDIGALKKYLASYYENLGYSADEIAENVARDTAEYTSGAGGYADGGRIGYSEGNLAGGRPLGGGGSGITTLSDGTVYNPGRPDIGGGGELAYDATNTDIYGSSAASFTPKTIMNASGDQVQAGFGKTPGRPVRPGPFTGPPTQSGSGIKIPFGIPPGPAVPLGIPPGAPTGGKDPFDPRFTDNFGDQGPGRPIGGGPSPYAGPMKTQEQFGANARFTDQQAFDDAYKNYTQKYQDYNRPSDNFGDQGPGRPIGGGPEMQPGNPFMEITPARPPDFPFMGRPAIPEYYTGKNYGPGNQAYAAVMPQEGMTYVYDEKGTRYSVPIEGYEGPTSGTGLAKLMPFAQQANSSSPIAQIAGMANGGRIGYQDGTDPTYTGNNMEDLPRGLQIDTTTSNPIPEDAPQQEISEVAKIMLGPGRSGIGEPEDGTMKGYQFFREKYLPKKVTEIAENYGIEENEVLRMIRDEMMQYIDSPKSLEKPEMANGGRMGFAMGNPEENAVQASGIMNLPLNQNPAGITELDLRETGGFIPPVGVKEKADDIPAMLSNNEFVFTADAVRGMGDGNVNKGAQRMYDMMKKLEKGGRV